MHKFFLKIKRQIEIEYWVNNDKLGLTRFHIPMAPIRTCHNYLMNIIKLISTTILPIQ